MDSGNCVAGPCRGEALKKVAIHIEGEQVFLNEDLFIRAENWYPSIKRRLSSLGLKRNLLVESIIYHLGTGKGVRRNYS